MLSPASLVYYYDEYEIPDIENHVTRVSTDEASALAIIAALDKPIPRKLHGELLELLIKVVIVLGSRVDRIPSKLPE